MPKEAGHGGSQIEDDDEFRTAAPNSSQEHLTGDGRESERHAREEEMERLRHSGEETTRTMGTREGVPTSAGPPVQVQSDVGAYGYEYEQAAEAARLEAEGEENSSHEIVSNNKATHPHAYEYEQAGQSTLHMNTNGSSHRGSATGPTDDVELGTLSGQSAPAPQNQEPEDEEVPLAVPGGPGLVREMQDDGDDPNAFFHPATKEKQRVLWLPKDELGLCQAEIEGNRAAGVLATNRYAVLNVKVSRLLLWGPRRWDMTGKLMRCRARYRFRECRRTRCSRVFDSG
jgi:hypothetical protein